MYIRDMIVLPLSFKAIQHIVTVSNLGQVEKGMKFRNIWIVATYLQLSHADRRILEFSLQHQYPFVQKLQYHLPGEQLVVFSDREDLFRTVNKPKAQKTMLTM